MAIGIVLPFFTGQIQQIGNMLLPMHLPVMLCGMICSWRHGATVGATLPLLRSLMFGMPVLFPNALAMAFECATYGFLVGFLFEKVKRRSLISVYACLIASMLAGRAVWGTVMLAFMGMGGRIFTFSAFLAGAFTNAVPGIIAQLVIIPSVILVIEKAQNKKIGTHNDSADTVEEK